MIILFIVYFALLLVLPGSWITFGAPLDEFSLKARLALGMALSPAVLGVQYLIIKSFGVCFGDTARLLLVINLPATFLILRRIPQVRLPGRMPKVFFCGVFLLLLLSGFLILPWILHPLYRTFSWHALMHTDIIYALTRSSLIPEEPELAGLTLSFGWIPHIFWGVLGWLSDWAPTAIYPISNLVMLVVTFMLIYELARHGLGLSEPGGIFSIGFLFLGTNIIGVLIWLITMDPRHWRYILGDTRYTPLLGKYLGFETMPFAFALLIGLIFVSLVSMRVRVKFLYIIVAALLTSLGLIYPILFPAGCIFVGGLLFLLISRWAKGLPKYSKGELVLLTTTVGLSVAAVMLFLYMVTQDRVQPSFQFALSGKKSSSLQVITALIPFWLISIPFLLRSILKRDGSTMLLVATSICMMVLYIFIDLDNTEYKYVMCATIFLAPICAASIDDYYPGTSRVKWFFAVLIPTGLITVHLFLFFQVGKGLPRSLEYAPEIVENSFWISLDSSDEDAAWTRIIRESTAEDTIVVDSASRIHSGPFLNRSLYFPSDTKGEYSAGYSLNNRFILIDQRGYSDQVYSERLNAVQTLFNDSDPLKLASSIRTLVSTGRPLAIRFSRENTPALMWLKHWRIGSQLYFDESSIIWYIDSIKDDMTSLPNDDELEN